MLIFWILAFTNKKVESVRLNFRRPTQCCVLATASYLVWTQPEDYPTSESLFFFLTGSKTAGVLSVALRPPCFYILLRIKVNQREWIKPVVPSPADVIIAHRHFNQTSVLSSSAASPGTSITSTCRFEKGKQAKIDVWLHLLTGFHFSGISPSSCTIIRCLPQQKARWLATLVYREPKCMLQIIDAFSCPCLRSIIGPNGSWLRVRAVHLWSEQSGSIVLAPGLNGAFKMVLEIMKIGKGNFEVLEKVQTVILTEFSQLHQGNPSAESFVASCC